MARLLIELKKLSGGGAVLRCTRSDGSITWQRNDGRRGLFFAFHDLRHYAAECVFGFREGFYGLVALGWEIADTTGKGSRGRLPDETLAVEHLVGLLDADSASGSATSAAEFNQHAAAYAAQNDRPAPQPITEEDLEQIRSMAAALHAEWLRLTEGATIRLSFPPEA